MTPLVIITVLAGAVARAQGVPPPDADVPPSRIFEKDGGRYQQFGGGLALPLHPGLSRAWGAGYPAVDDGHGRKLYLVRPPFVMFAPFEPSRYPWYQGIPTRADFPALRGLNRHPVLTDRLKAAPEKPPRWETGEDFDAFLASISPENKVLDAFRAAKDYADQYDWASRQGNLTGREHAYAEKAVRILARLADAFPRWHAQRDRAGRPGEDQSKSGLWLWPSRPNQFKQDLWGPLPAAEAYDLLYNADAWEKVGSKLGYDVRRRVEVRLLQEALWHQARMGGPFGTYSNRDKYVCEGLCRWAVCLDDPVLYHFGIRLLEDQARQAFMADGTYYELCYVEFLVDSLMDEYEGLPAYTDPPGWTDPFDRSRIDARSASGGVLPSVAAVRRHVMRVSEFQRRLQLPDGRLWSLNESAWDKRPMARWYQTPGSSLYRQPEAPERSRPELLTWSGHSMLGRGEGPGQVQVRLEYSDHPSPHVHDDAFALGLFANGQELLADNSYVHKDGWCRGFSRSAADHNTVVVCGRAEKPARSWAPFSGPKPPGAHYFSGLRLVPGLKLLQDKAEGQGPISQTLWAPDGPVQMMEVYHPNYRGASHRRTVVVAPRDDHNVYVVDVYRASGGEFHEWSLHGPSQHEYRITVDAPLGPEAPDTLPAGLHQRPELSYVRSAAIDEPVRFDIVVPECGLYEPAERIRRGCLHTTLTGDSHTVVQHGLTANARHYDQQELGVRRSARKEHLVVRRPGPASLFVAVHEPYEIGGNQPVIRGVRQHEYPGGVLAITVALPHREDTIFLSERDQGTARLGDVSFSGQAAYVSRGADGRVLRRMLVHGDRLSVGDLPPLAATRTFAGKVLKISRQDDEAAFNAFLVEGHPASGLDLAGRWVTIELGDGHLKWFPVRQQRREEGNTWLITDWEPGLSLRHGYDPRLQADTDWVEYLYFPRTGVLGGLQARVVDAVQDER